MNDTHKESSEPNYEKFMAYVNEGRKQPVYIIAHRGLCFDGIGSALGIRRLLEKQGVEGLFCFDKPENSSGFPQNIALYNQLGIDDYVNSPKKIKKNSKVIYVDCHPGASNLYHIRGFPFAVIDHHDSSEQEKEILMTDLRLKYIDMRKSSSCTSLILGYLKHFNNLDLNKNRRDDVVLATTMMAGIRVDTNRFSKTNNMFNEYNSASILHSVADMDLIRSFEGRKKYPPEVLRILGTMTGHNNISKGRYRVGIIPLDDIDYNISSDEISASVEALRDFDGPSINIILAYSKKQNKATVRIRSDDAAYHAQQELEKIFGLGGGKEDSGGIETTAKEFKRKLGMGKVDLSSSNFDRKIKTTIENKLIP